jgi:hypothetical protein
MKSSMVQRQVTDELVAGSGDLRDVQQAIIAANRESDAAGEMAHEHAVAAQRESGPNPLWAVNGALAAFVFAALMYLASR